MSFLLTNKYPTITAHDSADVTKYDLAFFVGPVVHDTTELVLYIARNEYKLIDAELERDLDIHNTHPGL
jgi:hypothetical protein